MPYATQPTRCTKCKRTGLPPDAFPKSAHGYVYGECLQCEAKRVARYREDIAADPVRLAIHRRKERMRSQRNRDQRRATWD